MQFLEALAYILYTHADCVTAPRMGEQECKHCNTVLECPRTSLCECHSYVFVPRFDWSQSNGNSTATVHVSRVLTTCSFIHSFIHSFIPCLLFRSCAGPQWRQTRLCSTADASANRASPPIKHSAFAHAAGLLRACGACVWSAKQRLYCSLIHVQVC